MTFPGEPVSSCARPPPYLLVLLIHGRSIGRSALGSRNGVSSLFFAIRHLPHLFTYWGVSYRSTAKDRHSSQSENECTNQLGHTIIPNSFDGKVGFVLDFEHSWTLSPSQVSMQSNTISFFHSLLLLLTNFSISIRSAFTSSREVLNEV